MGGKIETGLKISIENKDDLSIAYTPGVAAVSRLIAEDKNAVYTHTIKKNTVAVVSDGSAVLGLGNIGPEAALPVMEGKAALFKRFANIDAVPLVLATQDADEIVRIVKAVAPGFAGINLEDISAPRCFEIEERLQDIGIPVFHDDQHGTAIVVRSALINAAKVVGKDFTSLRVVINGAGSAGIAIAKLLGCIGAQDVCKSVADIILCDSKGIIHKDRNDLTQQKKLLAEVFNTNGVSGTLADAIVGADVFIGVSVAGALSKEMIVRMAEKSIVCAMANPVPEIMPDLAKAAGVAVMATGRSDFPNQINNVLAFPGIFRGALDVRASRITEKMKLAAADAIASLIEHPSAEEIIPSVFDERVVGVVARAVRDTA